MPAVLDVLLALWIKSIRRHDMDVGIVLGYGRKSSEVVHVFVRLDERRDLVVGQHGVDAFALEAFIHPGIIPAAVEEIFGGLSFEVLDFDQAGVASCVVRIDTVFSGNGPGFIDPVEQKVRSCRMARRIGHWKKFCLRSTRRIQRDEI